MASFTPRPGEAEIEWHSIGLRLPAAEYGAFGQLASKMHLTLSALARQMVLHCLQEIDEQRPTGSVPANRGKTTQEGK